MLLFRSEEHVDQWCEARGIARGATMSLGQLWRLATVWHANRMAPHWRRQTPEEGEAAFADVGLTGPFWKLE